MKASAFTLLELLVALAVLVAVSGLALPTLLGRLEGSRLDAALSQFGAAVVMLRAQAQERGQPMELLATRRDGAEEIGSRSLGDEASEADKMDATALIRNLAILPSGLEVTTRNPTATVSAETAENSHLPVRTGTLSEPRRLAVFMPDGTVIASGPLFVKLGDRVFEIAFNTWTGGVRSRELLPDESQEVDAIEPPVEDAPISEGKP